MEDKVYAVVHFMASDEVELVPSIWLRDNDSKTVWPPFKSAQALKKAVIEQLAPRSSDVWAQYDVRVLRRCETYEEGRRKTREAEDLSDLQTTDVEQEPHKRRQRKKRAPPSWSEDDSDDGDLTRSRSLQPAPRVRQSEQSVTPYTLDVTTPTVRQAQRSLTPYTLSNASTPRSRYQSLQPAPTVRQPEQSVTPYTPSDVTVPTARQPERSMTPYTLSDASTPRSRQGGETRQITGTGRDFAILKALSEVQVKLGEISDKLTNHTQILSKLQNAAGPEPELDLPLPIQTLAELDEVESLLDDKATKSSLINHLSKIGGDNVKDGVRRAMSRVLAHTVQMELNWNGRTGWKTKDGKSRRAFGETKMSKVVKRALMKSFRGASETEIEDAAMAWLRGKNDRNGGRKRRSNGRRGEDVQQEGN